MIWLYDEYNAGLYLFDYVANKIIQSVTNMTSIVGLGNVKQLIEIESNLYVLDAQGKIIVFDLFMNQKFNFTINGEKIYNGDRSISNIHKFGVGELHLFLPTRSFVLHTVQQVVVE